MQCFWEGGQQYMVTALQADILSLPLPAVALHDYNGKKLTFSETIVNFDRECCNYIMKLEGGTFFCMKSIHQLRVPITSSNNEFNKTNKPQRVLHFELFPWAQ